MLVTGWFCSIYHPSQIEDGSRRFKRTHVFAMFASSYGDVSQELEGLQKYALCHVCVDNKAITVGEVFDPVVRIALKEEPNTGKIKK